MPVVEPLDLARCLMDVDTSNEVRREILQFTTNQTRIMPEDQEIQNVLAAVKSDRFSDDEHLETFLKWSLKATGGYDEAKPLEEQLKPYFGAEKPNILGEQALAENQPANQRKTMLLTAKQQMVKLLEESQKQSAWIDRPEDEVRAEAIRRKKEETSKYNSDRRMIGGPTLGSFLAAKGTSSQDVKFDENDAEQVKAAVEELKQSEYWGNARTARRSLAPLMSEEAERGAYLMAASTNPEAWGKQILPGILDRYEQRNTHLSAEDLKKGLAAESGRFLQMVRVMRPELDAGVLERVADSVAAPWIQTGRALVEQLGSQGANLFSVRDRNIEWHDRLQKEFGVGYASKVWDEKGAVRPEVAEKFDALLDEAVRPFGVPSMPRSPTEQGVAPEIQAQIDSKRAAKKAEWFETSRARAMEGKREREADRVEYLVENSLFDGKFKKHGEAAEFFFGTVKGVSYMMQFQAVAAVPVVGGPSGLFLMYASMQSELERKGIYEWGLDPKAAQRISTPVALFQAAIERQQMMELKGAFGYKEYIGAQDRGVFFHAMGQFMKRSAGITASETGEEILQNAADYGYAVAAKYGAQARGIDLTEEWEQMVAENWETVKQMPLILMGSGLVMRGAMKLSGNAKMAAPEFQMAREDMMDGPQRWQAKQAVRKMKNTVRGQEDAVDAISEQDLREYMRLKGLEFQARTGGDGSAGADGLKRGPDGNVLQNQGGGLTVLTPENTSGQAIGNRQSETGNALDAWLESRGYNPLTDKPLFEMKEALVNQVVASINDRVAGFNETIAGVEDDDTVPDDLRFYEANRQAKILGLTVKTFDTQAEAAAAYSAIKTETDKGTVVRGVLIGRELVMVKQNILDADMAVKTLKEEVGHRVVAVNPNKGTLLGQVRSIMGDAAIQAMLPEYRNVYGNDLDAFSDEFIARKILSKLDTAKGRKLLEEKGLLGKLRSAVLDVFGMDVKSDELAAKEVIRLAMEALEDATGARVQSEIGNQAVDVMLGSSRYQRSAKGEWSLYGSAIRDPETIAILNAEASKKVQKAEAKQQKSAKDAAEKRVQQMADADPVIKMVLENGGVQMPAGKESTWPDEYKAIPKRFRGKDGQGLPLDEMADQVAALKGMTADYSTSEFRAELEAFEAKADSSTTKSTSGSVDEEAELVRQLESGLISQDGFDQAMAELTGARFSVDGKDYTFGQIADSLPIDEDPSEPLSFSGVRGFENRIDVVLSALLAMDAEVAAGTGDIVLLHNPQGGGDADKIRERAKHLSCDQGTAGRRTQFNEDKAKWVPFIQNTVFSARAKISDPDGKEGFAFYAKRYFDGVHYVLVNKGTVVDHSADEGLLTHFLKDGPNRRYSSDVLWVDDEVKNTLIGKQASGKAASGTFAPATPFPSYENETPKGGKSQDARWSVAPPVESEAFKTWSEGLLIIGSDSDSVGKPGVYEGFHGGSKWNVMSDFKGIPAVWAAAELEDAYTYAERNSPETGEIKPLYLRMKNPLDLRNMKTARDFFGYDLVQTSPIIKVPDGYELEDRIPDMHERIASLMAKNIPKENAEMLKKALELGFDGIIHYDTDQYNRGPITTYISLVSGAVKLRQDDSGDRWYDHSIRQDGNAGTWDGNNRDIRFSVDGMGFYSALERAVDGFKQETFTVDQLAGMVRNAPGVKAEELEDLGWDEFLASRGAKVTKAEALEFIRDGGPQIQEIETRKGVKTAIYMVINDDRNPVSLNRHATYDEAKAERDSLNDRMGLDIHNGYSIETIYKEDNTRYGQYQLPGGENYREVLLTLPNKNNERYKALDKIGASKMTDAEFAEYKSLEKTVPHKNDYKSSHWSEANVLAHVRLNDRIGPNGEKILFIEEIQSDWHQAGRKKGYKEKFEAGRMKFEAAEADFVRIFNEEAARHGTQNEAHWLPEAQARVKAARAAMNAARSDAASDNSRIPNAPFKKSWAMLAFKRVLRMAAEQGYDSVAWTPGEVQAERYDLSRQVDRVVTAKAQIGHDVILVLSGGKTLSFGVDEKGIVYSAFEPQIAGKNLDEVVGKELADKILSVEKEHVFEGPELKVGGEGMKGFYDQILPKEVQKYAGKLGGKVGTVAVGAKQKTLDQIAKEQGYRGWEQIVDDRELVNEMKEIQRTSGKPKEVWNLPIPAAMREKVMQGQPLFSLADDPSMLAVKKLAWHLVHFPLTEQKGARTKKIRGVLASAFKELGKEAPDNKELDRLAEEAHGVATEAMYQRDNGLVDPRELSKYVSTSVGQRWVQRQVANARRDGEIGGQLYEQEKQKVIRHFEAQGEQVMRKLRGYALGELKDSQGISFADLLEKMNFPPVEAPKPRETDTQPIDLHPEIGPDRKRKPKEDAEPDAKADAGGDENAPLPLMSDDLMRYGVDIRDWMGRIRTAVTRQLMKDGILRADLPLNKAMQSDFAEQAYRKTMQSMLLENTAALTHSFGRSWISNAILRLRDYKTMQGFDNEVERILVAANTYRVRETHEELVERLEEITKAGSQEYRKSRLSELARKYPAVLERIMQRIREAMFLDEEQVTESIDDLEQKLAAGNTKADKQDEFELMSEAKWVLEQYGAFRFKELSDKKTAIEYLEKEMADGLILQEQRREALKKQVKDERDLIKSVQRRGKLKGWGAKKVGDVWTGFIFFSQKLEELVAGGAGAEYTAAKGWAQKFGRDMGFAGYRTAADNFRAQQDLLDAMRIIYGTKNAADVVRDLTKKREDLAQFSLALGGGKPGQPLSRDDVLQHLAHLGNRRYRNAALIMQEMMRKMEAMSGTSAEELLQNKPQEEVMAALLTSPDSYLAYRSESTGVELNKQQVLAALQSIADGARLVQRLEMEGDMMAALEPGDWQLVEWLREYYRKNRKRLSKVAEEITGLMFEENDPNYMPVSVEGAKELIRDGGRPLPVTPASLTARKVHFLDLNEQAGGVVSMFLSRAKSNHQFIHFAKLHQYTNRLFSDVRFTDAVKLAHGEGFYKQIFQHATDIIAGGGPQADDDYNINKLTNILAVNALAWNASLFVKQLTALPTFSMYADGRFLEYTKAGVGAFAPFLKALFEKRVSDDNPAVQAMLDVFHSDYAQGRMQGGRDYVQRELLGELEGKANKYWESYVRKGMMFTKAGDMVPILTFGAGFYRSKLEEAAKAGMLPEEGKAWALDMLWQLVEQTQSATTPANEALYQRRGGVFAKLLGQFGGPTPGYVGKFVHDFRMMRAADKSGDPERIRAARKQWAATWGVLAVSNAMYTAVGVLWGMLLGDWPDEDDAERMLASVINGPFGGMLVVGALLDRGMDVTITGSDYGSRGMVPAESALNPAFYLSNSIWELLHGDLGKAGKSFDRALSGAQPIYRDVSRAVKNYSK